MKIPSRSRHMGRMAVALALCLAAGQALAVESAPELPDPGSPRITRDQQIQLGLQAGAEVYKQMPVLPDSSPETKYIQGLGKRLVATIPPARSWPFQFHVIAQKEINAFALPGGPMFVNVGTITAADNEAELAGVMAHEMAHVYMQHSAKQQEKSSLLGGIAGLAGALAGVMGGAWGTLAQGGIQFGAGTLMLKYSRGDEAQADAVGAIILWKAGYNPVALADFFAKLEAQGGNGPQFLSDHPNPGNRREAIQKEIQNWPPKQYSPNSPEFAAVRKDAAGVRVYTAQEIAAGAKNGKWAAENRKNGAVFPGAPSGNTAEGSSGASTMTVPAAPLANVQPSSSFVNADLGMMKIARPKNWDVMQGQRANAATIAPRAGVSGNAVAYGVVIQQVQTPDSNRNVQQLTASIAQSLESSDSNMKQTGAIQTALVNGLSAGSAMLETISPMPSVNGKAQSEQDWLVAVPRGNGQAIFLVFVAPHVHFGLMKPTFEKMLGSVRF